MDIRTHCAIGGERLQGQASALRDQGCHIMCATPGRLMDLIRRRMFDPSHVRVLVLDEVDVMLSQGFKEQGLTRLAKYNTS